MSTLHPDLLKFFEATARLCHGRALTAAARRLMQKYELGQWGLEGLLEHVAYVQCRMPATFSAVKRSLEQLKAVIPEFAPQTVLDLGTGPGTAVFAARLVLPTIQKAVGAEASAEFRELFAVLLSPPDQALAVDFSRAFHLDGTYDLVLASYLFGELSSFDQERLLSQIAPRAKMALFVEPGTPAGWRTLMRLRERLLALGARIVAPCPHHKTCPFTGTDGWCHQSIRLPRTSLQRRLKRGELGYEDEKFSYLAVALDPLLPAVQPPDRIVHAPRHRHGHSYAVLCTAEGLFSTKIISKKHKELYRYVRQAKWGDSLPSA